MGAALDADLNAAMQAFRSTAEDRRIWASIAWRVGVEAFHFALVDRPCSVLARNQLSTPL